MTCLNTYHVFHAHAVTPDYEKVVAIIHLPMTVVLLIAASIADAAFTGSTSLSGTKHAVRDLASSLPSSPSIS